MTLDTAKRTPWFPPEITPVRKGHYECHVCCVWRGKNSTTHFWNGRFWRYSDWSEGTPLDCDFKWRGLAEKP